jgi:hypothetical protein
MTRKGITPFRFFMISLPLLKIWIEYATYGFSELLLIRLESSTKSTFKKTIARDYRGRWFWLSDLLPH